MFESMELGHSMTKAAYREAVPALRAELLALQQQLLAGGRRSVLVLIAGVEGSGKGESVRLLTEWMDPRHVRVHAFGEPSDEERARPPAWRFWRALPPRGHIGVFFGSWYTAPIVGRVFRRSRRAELDQRLAEVNQLERMLAEEGVLLVKLWLHLPKRVQRKRLEALEADPDQRWRLGPVDWKFFARYDRFYKVSTEALRETSTAWAPWIVIDGTDPRHRAITVGTALRDALRRVLASPALVVAEPEAAEPVAAEAAAVQPAAVVAEPVDRVLVLDRVDCSRSLPPEDAEETIERWQGELAQLSRHPRFREHSVIAAFEGVDAGGKGGAIRRVAAALDPRQYEIVPVAAPSDEERAHPYLWRFWRHVPPAGRFTLFDRSWYGRVLVERVEGFCAERDWTRAYEEINQFEAELVNAGAVVVKLWLQVSAEEQLRRFRERESTEWKRFKITPDDWRNRERWDDYRRAASEMIDRTSTSTCPWTIVEADDKAFARAKVLRTLARALQARLGER